MRHGMMAQTSVQEKLNPDLYKRKCTLMGNCLELSIFCRSEEEATEAFNAAFQEMQRVETLLTNKSLGSPIYQINAHAGDSPVSLSSEVYDLIVRSIKVSELTKGAFDVTKGCTEKNLYYLDAHQIAFPKNSGPKVPVPTANYKDIELNPETQTVYLGMKSMRLDLQGIAKGYAIERAKVILTDFGIKSGVVNAGGDLTAWGTQPNGCPWTFGAANTSLAHLPFAHFNISELAVATSGEYEKGIALTRQNNDSPIPSGILSSESSLKSATIACPNAELAQAMATGIRAMKLNAALEAINDIRNIACILVDEHGVMHLSENIQLRLAC